MCDPGTNCQGLSGPQRREILASDPVTGEVHGPGVVREALVAKKLAQVYGRRGATYLTEAGRQVRARLQRHVGESHGPPESSEPGGFAAATGDETAGEGSEDRAEQVARAWAGVVEIRRLSGAGGVPAAWERSRMVWAVALALEAAGVPASAVDRRGRRVRSGYRVVAGAEPGSVRVEWRGPAASGAHREAEDRLGCAAARLAERGWAATAYLGSGGRRYLVVVPRT